MEHKRTNSHCDDKSQKKRDNSRKEELMRDKRNKGKQNLVIVNQSLVTTVTQAIPCVLRKILCSTLVRGLYKIFHVLLRLSFIYNVMYVFMSREVSSLHVYMYLGVRILVYGAYMLYEHLLIK